MTFKELHYSQQPLLLCNVWDASSAQIAKELGFKALGTSSAAIAKTLGKEDGENIAFNDLIAVVANISVATNLPLTVDIESGYGDSVDAIVDNIQQLSELGVVGINIEDSAVNAGKRELCDASGFTQKLNEISSSLRKVDAGIFINIRTDCFLMGIETALEETIKRLALYQSAGADGIFVPGVKDSGDIQRVVASTDLPINVMCVPGLPDFATLQELGVKRISMGNFLHEAMLSYFSSTLSKITAEGSFKPLFT